MFQKIHRVKPNSSRSESSELFLLCVGFIIEHEDVISKEKMKGELTEEEIKLIERSIKIAKYQKVSNEGKK